MYYRECPRCGCNLDTGEKCDCQEQLEQSIEYFKKITIVEDDGQIKFKEMQNEDNKDKD